MIQMQWRAMTADDLPAVNVVADKVHPDFPEDPAIFRERLTIYPDGCHVLADDAGQLHGYIITHPWMLGTPPALNALLQRLPDPPTTYYIHDVAMLPTARGGGHAAKIIRQLQQHARGAGFSNMSLIAVNGTPPFWARYGFVRNDNPQLTRKLASYSADATFMTCELQA